MIGLSHAGHIHQKIYWQFKNTEKDYYLIRDVYRPQSLVDEAARFYYLRKTCFRGMIRYNKSGKFNVPYGHYKKMDISDLTDIRYSALLKNVEVLNYPFEQMFEIYNHKEFFMFLDPPYHNVFKDYDKSGFTEDDHIKLSECFKSTNNQCLMIIGKTDFIVDLYKDYIIEEYDKKYSIDTKSEKANVKHLIIKNY